MNCPYCEQPLPNIKTYMHICPFCHTVISSELKKKILPRPTCDSFLEIYAPSKDCLLDLGKKRYDTITSLRTRIKRNHILPNIWGHILGSLFTFSTIFLLIDGEEKICMISAIVSFFIACLIFKEYQTYTNKMSVLYSSDSNIPMPICYYGNQDIFGIASVPANCNDSNTVPDVYRTEIQKSKIIAIVQEDGQDPWVDIQYYDKNNQMQQITILLFCDILSLRNILGLHA